MVSKPLEQHFELECIYKYARKKKWSKRDDKVSESWNSISLCLSRRRHLHQCYQNFLQPMNIIKEHKLQQKWFIIFIIASPHHSYPYSCKLLFFSLFELYLDVASKCNFESDHFLLSSDFLLTNYCRLYGNSAEKLLF